MADSSLPGPGLGDLLALLGGTNPLAGVTKSIQQFQRGVNDFLSAVENFNATMEQMNIIAARVNRLLDDVEPPVRALMPQLTRSITAMDALAEQMSGPIERVAPGLSRLAEVLQSPQVSALPRDLSQVVDIVGDLGRRLQPLGQLAETATGIGILRQFTGGLLANRIPSTDADSAEPERAKPATTPAKASVKPAKSTAAPKAPAKRAKSTAAPKAPAKRAAPGTRSSAAPKSGTSTRRT
jgi:uncharacterized phage infection (PIP) family protein YhgE